VTTVIQQMVESGRKTGAVQADVHRFYAERNGSPV